GLNGVRVFKKRQGDFAGRVLYVGVAREGTGTVFLVIETEILAAESGRTTLGSFHLDVPATSCCTGRHRCFFLLTPGKLGRYWMESIRWLVLVGYPPMGRYIRIIDLAVVLAAKSSKEDS